VNKIGVILNTLPLIQKKAGIGYCVHNLYHRLKEHNEIILFPAHNLRPGFFALNKILKSISAPLKRVAGSKYPNNLAAAVYNFGVAPSLTLSKFKIRKILYRAQIYHETRHTIIEEFEPYMDSIKLVSDIHDVAPLIYPQWCTEGYVKGVQKCVRRLMSSDCIITKSNFIKNQLIREFGVSEQKITVIPNAPGANYYPLPPEEKRKARKKMAHIVGDSDFLLYTGTVEPRKNLKTLFDAIKIIKGKHNLKLIIAGGFGWKYDDIVEYPQRIGIEDTVKFLGYTAENTLLGLYNLCEAFVYPSWYEGFGIPPLEAMACGTVPIVANSASLPEVVGDGGLLFEPHSPEELADKIDCVITNEELKHELITKGIERARQYNWDDITKQTVNLYKKVVYEQL